MRLRSGTAKENAIKPMVWGDFETAMIDVSHYRAQRDDGGNDLKGRHEVLGGPRPVSGSKATAVRERKLRTIKLLRLL